LTSQDTDQIKNIITGWGANLVGIADAEPLESLKTDPADLLSPFTRVISIAVQLPVAMFEMIDDQPTAIYASVYQTANRFLDKLALKTATMLQNEGYLSLPVPASQILDRENWSAAISHKAVARMAGLGWQGKNLLLITHKYGSSCQHTHKCPAEN